MERVLNISTGPFKSRFIPSKRKGSKFLMIVLHGRGDSIRPFYGFDSELNIPEMNYLLLNAPRKFLDGWSWYGEPPYQKAGVQKIRENLSEIIAQLEVQGWQSKNIFLFGFSQGCLVSADFALNFPRQLGGVVGISGYFQFFPRWRNHLTSESRKTPWLFTHGTKDDVLPIETTKLGAKKLLSEGMKVKWVEMEKDHVLEDSEYPIIRNWVKSKLETFKKP